MPSKHRALAVTVLAITAASVLTSCGDGDDSTGPLPSGELPSRGELLFVVRGPAEVSSERLAIETDVVEWFRERPSRAAGAVRVDQLVETWRQLGFDRDPPNAAASGAAEVVTLELRDPRLQGDEISFAYDALMGDLPSGDQGFLSLFIDAAILKFKAHKDNPT